MKNSTTVTLAGFVLTAIGLLFWPLLLLGVPLLIAGGVIRQGERWRQGQP